MTFRLQSITRMSSIIINYYEHYGNTRQQKLLGSEVLDGVEEALLPTNPEFVTDSITGKSRQEKIFMSKKFVARDEYRWQVLQVAGHCDVTTRRLVFDVALTSRRQVEKDRCLTQIMKQRKKTQNQHLQAFLRPFHFVEVEYGHPMSIGKATGEVKSNKRYPESFQLGSMPKRRLAIVLKVTQRKTTCLVQVVPISSVQPAGHDQSCVEVTNMIASFGFSDYKKQCWAICGMVEHVSATRIFVPEINFGGGKFKPSFRAELKGEDKKSIQRALVYGVGVQAVVEEKNNQIAMHEKKIAELQKQLGLLQTRLEASAIHEAIAREYAEILDDNFEDTVAKRIKSEMACGVSDEQG